MRHSGRHIKEAGGRHRVGAAGGGEGVPGLKEKRDRQGDEKERNFDDSG